MAFCLLMQAELVLCSFYPGLCGFHVERMGEKSQKQYEILIDDEQLVKYETHSL